MCRSATVRLSDCDCEGMKLIEMLGVVSGLDPLRTHRASAEQETHIPFVAGLGDGVRS